MDLFEGILFQKANDLMSAGKLDAAFDYFSFLEDNYPQMAGLAAASEKVLFEQAKAFLERRQ